MPINPSPRESSLVQWILDLNRRGFPPYIIDVRRMADALLAARGQDPPPPPVGKNWVSRFVNSQSKLQTKWNRKPLDVGCFSPLKRAYGHEIQELARQGVYHIDKIDFLTAYTRIRPAVLTQQNIQAGFQATGLIPPCPERVLSSLTVVRTPSPPGTTADNNVAWTAETPRTIAQLEKQAQHVKDLLHY
ncbi:plasma membrane calcium-transporting atpase 2 [Stemphylium lycopersici]|uniref:Plasma membrane calcium-transporting atpase 2 n=1 Tax=Stemphylium lycopersici TaxID=183478 RepID=A0A364NA96_STELY|nr:plasma membrane calcium-transporting atpase 2 [Stemphylium lycopersici]